MIVLVLGLATLATAQTPPCPSPAPYGEHPAAVLARFPPHGYAAWGYDVALDRLKRLELLAALYPSEPWQWVIREQLQVTRAYSMLELAHRVGPDNASCGEYLRTLRAYIGAELYRRGEMPNPAHGRGD